MATLSDIYAQLLLRGANSGDSGRMSFSRQLLAQATDGRPVYSTGAALAKALSGGLAGYMAGREQRDAANERNRLFEEFRNSETERQNRLRDLGARMWQMPAPAAAAVEGTAPTMPANVPPPSPVQAEPLPAAQQRGEAPAAVSDGIAARAALDPNAPDYPQRLMAINDRVIAQTMPGQAMPRPAPVAAPAAAMPAQPAAQPPQQAPGLNMAAVQQALLSGDPEAVAMAQNALRLEQARRQMGGAFRGDSIEAQSLNILLAPGANPASPEYEAAWLRLYGPQRVRQPNGEIIVTTPPAPQGIRPPARMAQQGDAAPAPTPGPAGSAPETTETVRLPGGGSITTLQTRPRQLSPAELQLREETENTLSGIRGAQTALTQALELSPRAYAGFMAEQRGALAGTTGYDSDTAVATRQFSAIMTEQALSQLRAIFGGNPTEGERAILLQMQASAGMSRAEREALIRRALEAVRAREQSAVRRLEEIVGGTYGRVQPGFQAPPAPASTPPAGGAPRRVNSPAEAEALPPGTVYETPDGRRFTR